VLGTGEATTLSFDSAIMAPSLKTASSTIRMVGKYLRVHVASGHFHLSFCHNTNDNEATGEADREHMWKS
jgi:hypothetical protein